MDGAVSIDRPGGTDGSCLWGLSTTYHIQETTHKILIYFLDDVANDGTTHPILILNPKITASNFLNFILYPPLNLNFILYVI